MGEQESIVEFLCSLDDEEVYALARTVTQGLLKIDNRDGKITALTQFNIN